MIGQGDVSWYERKSGTLIGFDLQLLLGRWFCEIF